MRHTDLAASLQLTKKMLSEKWSGINFEYSIEDDRGYVSANNISHPDLPNTFSFLMIFDENGTCAFYLSADGVYQTAHKMILANKFNAEHLFFKAYFNEYQSGVLELTFTRVLRAFTEYDYGDEVDLLFKDFLKLFDDLIFLELVSEED